MAKFRNTFEPTPEAVAPEPNGDPSPAFDRTLGDLLVGANHLTEDQVAEVLAYQRANGVRFGEAAIALGLVKGEDVMWALSQQFHYPYSQSTSSPTSAELVVSNDPFGEQAEAFRALRSQILMRLYNSAVDAPRRALAVVSPDVGDGKTFFAANLAVALSQVGGRTLLVDADMRKPRQHLLFGVENGIGLSTILSGRKAQNVISPVPGLPSLFVLPVGATPPNPLELVERSGFGLLMKEFIDKFDHVVVDTPAAAHGTDFAVIASRCGSALLVSRINSNRVVAVEDCVGILTRGEVKMAGVVVNDY